MLLRLYFNFPKVITFILFVVVGGCYALLLFSGVSVRCVLLPVLALICFSEVQFATSFFILFGWFFLCQQGVVAVYHFTSKYSCANAIIAGLFNRKTSMSLILESGMVAI